MEESEKRRERLRALRNDAAQAEASSDPGSHEASGALTNPLLDSPDVDGACATPRFDFYTDPMAAFSSGNRRSNLASQNQQNFSTPRAVGGIQMMRLPQSTSGPGPRNSEMIPSHLHQQQSNCSPEPRMHQTGPYRRFGPSCSPVPMRPPYPMYQGTPPGVRNELGAASSYYSVNSSGVANSPSPVPQWGSSPSMGSAQVRGQWSANSTSPVPMRPPYPMYQENYSANSSGVTNSSSPSFGSPAQVRAQWSANSTSPCLGRSGSPSPHLGRGRGRGVGSGSSPGSGQSNLRGSGPQGYNRTCGFYQKSMVEDPWKFLEPVIFVTANRKWQTLKSRNPATPHSAKKPKVSQAFDISGSNSKQSLADYLAASFDEAVEDAVVV